MSCFTELSTRSVQISINDCEDWGLLIVDVLTPNDQVLIEKCTQRTENALPIIDPLTTTYNYSEKQYSTNISNKVNVRNARSASLSSKYLQPNQPSFQHNWATSVIQFFYRDIFFHPTNYCRPGTVLSSVPSWRFSLSQIFISFLPFEFSTVNV